MGELTDRAKGAANKVVGNVKQMSDDADTRVEGKAQETKGKAQDVKGKVKGALGDDI